MLRGTHQVGAATAAFALAAAAAQPSLRLSLEIGRLNWDVGRLADLPHVVGFPGLVPPLGAGTALAALLAAIIGGVVPDFDKPQSFWRRLVVFPLTGGHRHLSHSLLGLVLFALVLALALPSIVRLINLPLSLGALWLAAVAGYASHLVLDSLTFDGVPWLYPIPWRLGFPPFAEWRLRTGGLLEQLVALPMLVILSGLVWYRYGAAILHWLG